MSSKHTAATIAAIITEQIEPQTAEAVLAALKPLDGQLITTRLLDKLPGGRVEWRLSRNFGWTEIKNRVHIRTQGASKDGVSLILARSEASVPLDVAFVERENPAYFAGRRERNALRVEAIANVALLSELAAAMNEVEGILEKLTAVKTKLAVYTEKPPCSVVKYDIERACGLREEKK